MNDNIREKLSAYLDGALPDAERRAVEVEISRSEEMRLELEALRAVSNAVKSLSNEPLPAGFMARLEARRARDAKPEREYFILPPAYRPIAFALSTAVVALVVWDRTHAPDELVAPKIGWDGDRVAVKSAADAPPSIDVSGKLSALGAAGGSGSAAKNEIADTAEAPATLGKHLNAPGKPLEVAEAAPAVQAPGAAPAPPAAAAALKDIDSLEAGQGGSLTARSEEERSAINERLYKGFEDEKKRMGIASILEKEPDAEKAQSGGRDMMSMQSSSRRASVASARGAAKEKAAAAPALKAIALKSADALQAAWAAAGLPGEPPAVNFSSQMAILLTGPAGSGIVTVQNRNKFIVVLYKAEGFDDSSARVKIVALSQKPVVVKLAQ